MVKELIAMFELFGGISGPNAKIVLGNLLHEVIKNNSETLAKQREVSENLRLQNVELMGVLTEQGLKLWSCSDCGTNVVVLESYSPKDFSHWQDMESNLEPTLCDSCQDKHDVKPRLSIPQPLVNLTCSKDAKDYFDDWRKMLKQ